MTDLKPHEAIAKAYPGKTGSPFQSDKAFKKPARLGLLILQLIPAVIIGLAFLAFAVSGFE